MKKFFAFILVCIMSCCCFLFAGCELTKTTEIYKFNAIRYIDGDNTITVEVNGKFNGVEIKDDSFILILHPDNTFALRCNLEQMDSSNNVLSSFNEVAVGTWMNGYDDEIYFAAYEEEDVLIGNKVDSNSIVFNIKDGFQIRFRK